MAIVLAVNCLATEGEIIGRAEIVTVGPMPASATIELRYAGPREALDWITSRRRLRADAELLLAAAGIERAGPEDFAFHDCIRAVMRELWEGLTGHPLDDVVLDRATWHSLTRVEREILRAQWRDGLGVEVEEIPGQANSRRGAIGWDGWLLPPQAE